MNFIPGHLYHLYNRGNNRQEIFFARENYIFFLSKVRKELLPFCDILAYCLMPNHFHFMLHVPVKITEVKMPMKKLTINLAIAVILRSYTQAINKRYNRTGSLFQQKTKAKDLSEDINSSDRVIQTCFHYIHQNPLSAKLVNKMEDWEYSSFIDYIGKRNGSLINKELTRELLSLPNSKEDFYDLSYQVINERKIITFY